MDDPTLLALLLTRGSSCDDPHQMARVLFERFGSLAAIVSADLPELARVGVGPVGLTDLKLMRILCERLARCEAARRPVISSWSALLSYIRIALAEESREQFRALFLDRRNQLIRDEMVAFGTVDHAPVYPREVVRRALDLSASALILVHNHPSGDPEPSRADITMTRTVADAAKLFDIQVHDHLIVGRDGTASLRTLGPLG
ncbi:DNA repair protein RadC [Brevundimonas sp. LM2]|uniref:RadC family protein n=1 Tax=Brevundimonas sp. LM2 TaxID=1938605 RepID=UPI00210F65EA|nr:DNA repair protein RadC [Brevundimonas sp. LM2]